MKATKPILRSARWPTASLMLVAMLLAMLIVSGTAQAQETSGMFRGHYYEVVFEELTWPEAVAYCEQHGGHLATITSEGENAFVYSLLPDAETVGQYWLGGSDEAVEGVWEWVTGEPFTYTNWGPGEPNDSAPSGNPLLGEDYLTFHGGDAYSPPLPGVWNDWQYQDDDTLSMLPFVCEYEPGSFGRSGQRAVGGGLAVLTDDGGAVGGIPEGAVMVNVFNLWEGTAARPAGGFTMLKVFDYMAMSRIPAMHVNIEGDEAAFGVWVEPGGYYTYCLLRDGGTPGSEGDTLRNINTTDEAQLIEWVETMYEPARTWTFVSGNITIR